jgi:hypothetical protein
MKAVNIVPRYCLTECLSNYWVLLSNITDDLLDHGGDPNVKKYFTNQTGTYLVNKYSRRTYCSSYPSWVKRSNVKSYAHFFWFLSKKKCANQQGCHVHLTPNFIMNNPESPHPLFNTWLKALESYRLSQRLWNCII